ncbi:MAG: hypothetical protein R3324_02820 [Halobacteriales archaeon]|nr:hypothetical protein [Halobacteriales archaeon]
MVAIPVMAVACGQAERDVDVESREQSTQLYGDDEGDTPPDPSPADVGTAGIPEVPEPGTTFRDVALVFDSDECRNNGSVEAGTVTWVLAEAVPLEWRHESPKNGSLTVVDEVDARFEADDGTQVRVTVGEQRAVCTTWE